jgi:hypothetical protein
MPIVNLFLTAACVLLAFPARPAALQTADTAEAPQLLAPALPTKILPEEQIKKDLSVPRSAVGNHYEACDPARLEWYYDLTELNRTMSLCGFDYLRLRFDRTYRESDVDAQATYFFTLRENGVSFDSISATILAGGTPLALSVRDLKINIPRPMMMTEWIDRLINSRNRVNAFCEYAGLMRDSFLSRLTLKAETGGLKYGFTFRIGARAYSVVGMTGDSGPHADIISHDERLDTLPGRTAAGACAIGFVNRELAQAAAPGINDPFLEERPAYARAVIRDYAMSVDAKQFKYDNRLKLFEINLTAKSKEGIRKIGVMVGGAWNYMTVDGSTLASYSVRLPYAGDCVDFQIEVQDIYGTRVSESVPRYVLDLEDNKRHAFTGLWQACDTDSAEWRADTLYVADMQKKKSRKNNKRRAVNILKLLPLLLF